MPRRIKGKSLKKMVGVAAAIKRCEIKGLERKTGQGGCIESQGLSWGLENPKRPPPDPGNEVAAGRSLIVAAAPGSDTGA
jgi:hypothetical protein